MSNVQVATTRPRLQMIFASLARADFVALMKNPRRLLLSFLLPVALLLATNSSKATQHLGGSSYIIGLSISIGILSTSILGYALGVARDREIGVFQRLRVTPAPTWAIMTSRLAMQMLANLIMALVVMVIGAQIHHDIALSITDYLLVLAISVLGSAVYLSIGQALVGLVKSADTVNAAGRVLLILLYLLGLFGQSGVLGGAWETLSRWSPVGVVMTLFAGALKVSSWDSRDWFSILACVCYFLVCTGIGIRFFRWEAR